jgi:hypothetical protein
MCPLEPLHLGDVVVLSGLVAFHRHAPAPAAADLAPRPGLGATWWRSRSRTGLGNWLRTLV